MSGPRWTEVVRDEERRVNEHNIHNVVEQTY